MARLPNKDRVAVMEVLQRNGRKYQGSFKLKKAVSLISKEGSEENSNSSSVNDWHHWVTIHGSEKVVREDVRSIGDTIGVKLGGCNNMFGVLARKAKGKKNGTANSGEGTEGLEKVEV